MSWLVQPEELPLGWLNSANPSPSQHLFPFPHLQPPPCASGQNTVIYRGWRRMGNGLAFGDSTSPGYPPSLGLPGPREERGEALCGRQLGLVLWPGYPRQRHLYVPFADLHIAVASCSCHQVAHRSSNPSVPDS